MAVINRVTMFKLKDASTAPKLVEAYQKMASASTKDGKSYILSYTGGPVADEPRNGGYGFAVQTTFASKADMDYYDHGDAAHAELKGTLKDLVAGPPTTIFFENALA